jgi:lysozyme
MTPLMRDPTTGRMLSRFETLARENDLRAAQVGASREDKALIALVHAIGQESKAVQDYVAPLVDAIQKHSDNLKAMKDLSPLLEEMVREADKDASLSPAEQKRAEHYLRALREWVKERLSVRARVGRGGERTTERVRERISKIAERAAGEGGGEGQTSYVAKLAAFALRPKKRNVDGQRERFETDASMYHQLARHHAQTNAQQKAVVAPAVAPHIAPPSTAAALGVPGGPKLGRKAPAKTSAPIKTPRQAPVKTARATATSKTGAPVTTKLLTSIHKVLQSVQSLLKSMNERDQRRHSSQQLTGLRVPQRLKPAAASAAETVEHQTSGIGSLLSGLFGGGLQGMLAKFGFSALGSLVTKMLIPALTVLGQGALVIGAAWAGWKVGEWIDKMTGASNIVQHAAEFLSNKLFGTATAHEENEAQKKNQINQARLVSKGKLINPTQQEAADFLRKHTEAQAKGLRGDAALNAALGTPTAAAPPAASAPTGPIPHTPLQLPQMTAGFRPQAPKKTTKQAPQAMTFSDKALTFIAKTEHFRSKPYWDVNGYAIGFGSHTYQGQSVDALVKANPKFSITRDEAMADMKARLTKEFVPVVRKSLTRPVSQNEFDALLSVAWNRGVGAYQKDKTFLDKVNMGTATAADFQKTVTNPRLSDREREGLTHRRQDEYEMFALDPRQSQTRQASSVAASASSGRAPVVNVIAPSTTNVTASGGPQTYVPVPLMTDNLDPTFRAITSGNGRF